jgi:hypothetical protein
MFSNHHTISLPQFTWAALVGAVFLLSSSPAFAVPSFSTQTGQACSACHVGAFGPQLTPYGRAFKLSGYTQNDGGNHGLPLAMMLQSSFTNTQVSQNPPPVTGFGPNSNFSLDQVSLFYAGAITENVGAFIQSTYDGVNNVLHWDNADVRYAHQGSVSGVDYTAGVTVNNNPTVQDLWNSTPAWGFPYVASVLAPKPAASTLIDNNLSLAVLGGGLYASVNDWVYVEADLYHGLSQNIRNGLGVVPVAGTDQYDGLMPYWRVAVQHDFNNEHYVEVGTFGIIADRFPGGDQTTGAKDHFTDNAVDLNYQWHANPDHIVSAHATYIHEDENLNASAALGSSNAVNRLNTFRTDVSYSYENTWTPSVQYFNTTGTKDANGFWGTATGSASPDSSGFITEIAYVPFGKPDSPLPWINGRLALQYVAYTKFDGTSQHASDNNTIFLNLWLSLDPVAPFYK